MVVAFAIPHAPRETWVNLILSPDTARMTILLSQFFSWTARKWIAVEVCTIRLLCRFLDQDIAQVEGFAGLDGEIFADLHALSFHIDRSTSR